MILSKNLLMILFILSLLVAGCCVFVFFLISEAQVLSEITLSNETDLMMKQRLEVIKSNCGIATNILFIAFILLLNVVAQLMAKWFMMKREQDRVLS